MLRKLIFMTAAILISLGSMAQSQHTSLLSAKAKGGANIYGVVECEGKPLQGVKVSDGTQIVLTDKNGVYSIKSDKAQGLVFICIPSGYMTDVDEGAVPRMWAELTVQKQEAERHDFLLHKESNTRHAIIAVADIHISNQYDDVSQYTSKVVPQIARTVEEYKAQGVPVYCLNAGDSSFDLFWYDDLFEIADFKALMAKTKFPVPMFATMGNHDNDPSIGNTPDTDFRAAHKFRKMYGPTYYSLDLGEVHYIVIDDIIYYNEPKQGLKSSKPGRGVVGARNYDSHFTAEQLAWLEKDLKTVEKDTPIVICTHCPMYAYKGATKSIFTRFKVDGKANDEEALKVANLLKDFSEVHFITGHTHRNALCYGKDDTSKFPIANTIDHNIAALSPAFWRTPAYGGQDLGEDSGPSGYEVFDISGKELKWYFHGLGLSKEQQFRAFDLNAVREEYRGRTELAAYRTHYEKAFDFATVEDNMVMIHVWAFDPKWKVQVWENGKELKVVRKAMENPQYNWSYRIPRSAWAHEWKKSYAPKKEHNMFLVKASACDTTLEICVTDGFGREYRETMVRPKTFSKQMR